MHPAAVVLHSRCFEQLCCQSTYSVYIKRQSETLAKAVPIHPLTWYAFSSLLNRTKRVEIAVANT